MRIFRDAVEAYEEVLRDITEMGIIVPSYSYQDKVVDFHPDFDTLEIWGYTYSITGFHTDLWLPLVDHCNLSWEYIQQEFHERVSGQPVNPGESWKYRKETWEPFITEEGIFAYTYAERFSGRVDWMNNETQLDRVIRELIEIPQTRQAILTIYDKHTDARNWGGKGRTPCSMHYQFLIRNGRLHIIYSQRSCDFMEHFPYDMIFAMKLAMHVWWALSIAGQNLGVKAMANLGIGHFVHQLGSLHIFRHDVPEGVF